MGVGDIRAVCFFGGHDLVCGQRAADSALAEIDQAQLLTAARRQLGGVFVLPGLAEVVGADDGDDRARVGVLDDFPSRCLAEGDEQFVAFEADDVGKGRIGAAVIEDLGLAGDSRRFIREVCWFFGHRYFPL